MVNIKFQELPEIKEDNLEKPLQNAVDSLYKEFISEKEKAEKGENAGVNYKFILLNLRMARLQSPSLMTMMKKNPNLFPSQQIVQGIFISLK
jgi:hypothetical protein